MEYEKDSTIESTVPPLPQVIVPVLIVLSLVAAGFVYLSQSNEEQAIGPDEETIAQILEERKYRAFEDIELEAHSAAVWDMTEKRFIYSKNPNAQLPLASLSKVMTALVAFESSDAALPIEISASDLEADGDNGLREGERWVLKDLLDFTLVESSNDGARALASAVEFSSGEYSFVDLMNGKAQKLGLKETYFLNSSGLDIDEGTLSGSYGSAHDVVVLFDYVLRNTSEILEATKKDRVALYTLSGTAHTAENTNEIIADIPHLMASKTGFTDLAGGNLVIAFDAGIARPFIISVLDSSREGRFQDMLVLYRATREYISGQSSAATLDGVRDDE